MSKAPERWSILKLSMYTMCTIHTKLLYSSKGITQQSSSNYDFSSNFVFTHGIQRRGDPYHTSGISLMTAKCKIV